MKRCISVLLAAMMFVFGMVMTNGSEASTVTHKVTDNTGTVTKVEITNVDLNAYSKYNADIQAVSKNLLPISSLMGTNESEASKNTKIIYNKRSNRMLGKATGSGISFRFVPESNLQYYYATQFLALGKRYDIVNNGFKQRDKGVSSFVDAASQDRKSHKIKSTPRSCKIDSADFIYICWFNEYDHTNPDQIKWARTINSQEGIKTEYYIFTSDEAFKKAYKIWTGKTITGPISSSSTTKKESAKTTTNQNKNNSKSTVQPKQSEDDSDGLGTIGMVGAGIAAAGAIGFGASRILGGGSGGSGAGTAEPVPQEPETFVYKDPATGAETLYEKDPNTGEWFDPSTGAITDPSKLEDYSRQRMQDRAWMNGQMENMRDRKTDVDRAWQKQDQESAKEMQKKFEEIDRQGAKDKAAIRSGTYGMSDAQRTEYLNKRQEDYVSKQAAAHRTAENWDRAVTVAEGTGKLADIGMDIAATYGKVVDGGLVTGRIADGYTLLKNIAGSGADAYSKGNSVVGGMTKGFVDGLVDVAQNNANTKIQKVAAFVGGDAFKAGLESGLKGESAATVLKKSFKGGLKGGAKLTIQEIGNNLENKIQTSKTDSLKNAYDHAREIRKDFSKTISPKSVETLKQMNLEKHLTTVKNANYQYWTNNIGNAVTKNTVPDALFGE